MQNLILNIICKLFSSIHINELFKASSNPTKARKDAVDKKIDIFEGRVDQ